MVLNVEIFLPVKIFQTCTVHFAKSTWVTRTLDILLQILFEKKNPAYLVTNLCYVKNSSVENTHFDTHK